MNSPGHARVDQLERAWFTWQVHLLSFPVSEPFFPGTDWSGLDWLEDSVADGSSAPTVAGAPDDLAVQVEEADNRRWTVDVYLRESNR